MLRAMMLFPLFATVLMAQSSFVLNGSGTALDANGNLVSVPITVTFYVNGQQDGASALVVIDGRSYAVNLRYRPGAAPNGQEWYSGTVEVNGVKVRVGLLIGHPQGPGAQVGWSGAGLQPTGGSGFVF